MVDFGGELLTSVLIVDPTLLQHTESCAQAHYEWTVSFFTALSIDRMIPIMWYGLIIIFCHCSSLTAAPLQCIYSEDQAIFHTSETGAFGTQIEA